MGDPSGSGKYSVLCPGMHKDHYCDCGGDCVDHEDFCDCHEANVCCEESRETVLCPNMPPRKYCDCEGDCEEHPNFCSCGEAQTSECCGDDDYDYDYDYDYSSQAQTTLS